MKTMKVRNLTRNAYEQLVKTYPTTVPVEQLPVWQEFQETIEGRTPWGYVAIEDTAGSLRAIAAFTQFETHGYRYLRSQHGPVWFSAPTPEEEYAAIEALIEYVRSCDKHQVFMRIAIANENNLTRPCLSIRPYDTTVIIDLSGGDDDILARMKPRGRRDVRKSLRECPASFADETNLAAESFEVYHRIMCETGERDGFTPAPCKDYQNMVRVLGADCCRVYGARVDGDLVAWSMLTFSNQRATRYYAATTHSAGRLRVADSMIFYECQQAAAHGCTEYDLMGIGSEIAPEMMNLNEFKTKFAKEGVHFVAPDRDVPIKQVFYAGLVKARDVRERLRSSSD